MDGNEERLAQLFDKLLNNAAEHSAPDAENRVTLRRSGGSHFELSVENEGDLLPQDKERIFEAFVSSQSRPRTWALASSWRSRLPGITGAASPPNR